jgi:ABC-type multidrug transport system permease subunit
LRQGKADIIVSAPPNAAGLLRNGKQVTLRVEYDTVNPYQNAVVVRIADPLAARLNEKLAAKAITGAQESGGPAASGQPNPLLLVAPTKVQAIDLAPTPPRLVSFYGVAVLALILQHLGLTLGALSTAGDRRQGMLTLLRVAPVNAFEMLLGKYVAFLVLTGVVTAGLVLLMHNVLGVPLLAPLESQVIQLALLVLLASVFFGGLAIDLSQFARPLQLAAEFLPVTQATRLGQDLFLRGTAVEPWRFAALGGMALVLSLVALLLLRRELLLRD